MCELIIIPEAFAGCKVYCSKCGCLYSTEVHMGCPECGELDLPSPPLEIPDDDFDPFADDAAFQREFGRA